MQRIFIRKIKYTLILTMLAVSLTDCGKSTISTKEAGERLEDIGNDFVTGERTVTKNEMKREAYQAAIDYIKGNLIDPSTVSFSDCDEDKIDESTDGVDLYYGMIIGLTYENKSGDKESLKYNVKVSGYPDYSVTEIKEVD